MKSTDRENIWKYSLIVLIICLGLLLFMETKQFLSGALGALTLYILLRRPMRWLSMKVRNTNLAAAIIVLATTLFIAIPFSLLVWFGIDKMQSAEFDTSHLVAPAIEFVETLEKEYDIDLISEKTMTFAAQKLTSAIQSLVNGIGYFTMNMAAALVLLFFLLQGGRKMENYVASVIPLKNINKKEMIQKINVMVKSNAIGSPLTAMLQGLIAWGCYAVFDVPNAFIAAMLTGLCSIVPIVGTMTIWVPLSIYFAVMGFWGKAIGLFVVCGIFIAQSDNLLRFLIQKKIADTHPLITIVGVLAGLPLFGFMGIIFGPLLVSLFLLFIDMFRKEYLCGDRGRERDCDDDTGEQTGDEAGDQAGDEAGDGAGDEAGDEAE